MPTFTLSYEFTNEFGARKTELLCKSLNIENLDNLRDILAALVSHNLSIPRNPSEIYTQRVNEWIRLSDSPDFSTCFLITKTN